MKIITQEFFIAINTTLDAAMVNASINQLSGKLRSCLYDIIYDPIIRSIPRTSIK